MILLGLFYSLIGLPLVSAVSTTLSSPPTIKLSWGTYEGREFENDSNIYIFENVRFGAKPQRFSAPAFPSWTNSSVQPVTDGRNCIQVNATALSHGPGGKNPAYNSPDDQDIDQSEDCLFLDLYVPKAVFQAGGPTNLPVVVWFYGGAYAFGSKDQAGPLYTGQSIISTSNYNTIFVAGNYRMGAYGFLAGDYMQKNAQPNAGLYDQALLLSWVQDNIGQVNGDPSQVSAWGESAGAGSILHHLIREDGSVKPNFTTYAVQSPAFQWSWDNRPDGTLDQVFKTFSNLTKCGYNLDIDCLRGIKDLSGANQELFNTVPQTGLFPVGPAVDGKWITTIPTVAFATGKYWNTGIKSTIISHCVNETASFTPKSVVSADAFAAFLEAFLPGQNLTSQRDEITARYDCTKPPFSGNYRACIATVIRDASFTCNTRDLFTAYSGRAYMVRYSYPLPDLAVHASDLVPLFTNNQAEAYDLLVKAALKKYPKLASIYSKSLYGPKKVAKSYQTYFASFALSGGNPNTLAQPKLDWPLNSAPSWPLAIDGEELSNVMTVRSGLFESPFVTNIADDENKKSDCAFWTNIAQGIMTEQKLSEHEDDTVEEL